MSSDASANPNGTDAIDPYDGSDIGPRYAGLREADLVPEDVPGWLARWSDLQKQVWEARAALKRDRSRDLTARAAHDAFRRFVDEVMVPFEAANQGLAAKLLGVAGWRPGPEHAQMVRQLRYAAEVAGAENVALEAEIDALVGEYRTRSASMATVIDGREATGTEVDARLHDPDPGVREGAWRAGTAPWLASRPAVDELALAVVAKRRQLAANAGLGDHREYAWRSLARVDYAPADCLRFHAAIEAELIPLAGQLWERRRAGLGVGSLRPWDLEADPDGRPPRAAFADLPAFEAAMERVFGGVEPELGLLFRRMREGGYLDLGWRKGKQRGGEEWGFPVSGMPHVLVGEDGTEQGASLLLHEMGHAYHDYLVLSRRGPFWDWNYPAEMAEFAAIAMQRLAEPHLGRDRGGFLPPEDAARARARALAEVATKWLPTIVLQDAFQHWLYADAPDAVGVAEIDATWDELSRRYQPWVDWRGLEAERALGWRRAGVAFGTPFYMVSYGLAHLGALQVARAASTDPRGGWRRYRAALGAGNARPLAELYEAAGARLPFGAGAVREAATFLRTQLETPPRRRPG